MVETHNLSVENKCHGLISHLHVISTSPRIREYHVREGEKSERVRENCLLDMEGLLHSRTDHTCDYLTKLHKIKSVNIVAWSRKVLMGPHP